MRILNITVLPLILLALISLGCSGGGNTPVINSSEPDPIVTTPPRDLVVDGRSLLMAYMVELDFETQEVSLEHLRTAANHFDIRPLLTNPWFCPTKNCLKIQFVEVDPVNGFFRVKATLVNPSTIVAHDVRGIVYDNDTHNHTLTNPDNYTKLWAPPGYDEVYPFKAFAKNDPDRAIHALASYSEIYEFQFDPVPAKWKFPYAIDCSWPSNCEEVYEISEITQVGSLYTTHGCIKLTCKVKHHSGPAHISKVILDTSDFLGEDLEMEYDLGDDIWEAFIMDEGLDLPEGNYDVLITAESPGIEIALYDFYHIDVLSATSVEQISGNVFDEDTGDGVGLAMVTTSDGLELYTDETDFCGFYTTGDVPQGSRVLSFAEPGYHTVHNLTVVQDEDIVMDVILPINPGPVPEMPIIDLNEPNINTITGVAEISGTMHNMDSVDVQGGVYIHQGFEYLMSVDQVTGDFFQGVILGYGENEIYLRATNAAGTVLSDPIEIDYFPEWNFRVTLTWDTDESDLDLHMWEPPDYSEHLYYVTDATTNLELDYDDVEGYGPENVTPIGDTIPEGIYPIAVDYYSDDDVGPSTGYITLRLNVGTPDEEIVQFSYYFTLDDFNNNYPVQFNTESWWRPCDLVVQSDGLITWQEADTSIVLYE